MTEAASLPWTCMFGHVWMAPPPQWQCFTCGTRALPSKGDDRPSSLSVLAIPVVVPARSQPRCATCKHWTGIQNGHGPGQSWDGKHGACCAVSVDPATDMAMVQSVDDYWSGTLWTRPDFGCVLHEEGEPG